MLKNALHLFIFINILLSVSCKNNAATNQAPNQAATETKITATADTSSKKLTLDEMLAKAEVPVLCYHHIREFDTRKALRMKEYEVTPAAFNDQMQALADNGFHTVLPEQLYDYLTKGKALPSKPVMLTYDDTDEEQFSIAKPAMDKHGFKGVYFIMTISIGRPNYMSAAQIKQLSDEGHNIACHTWDHHKVTAYTETDWDIQMIKPRKKLEDITGKKIEYFAYPFGLWDEKAATELDKRGYKLSFILSTKRDVAMPLQTVRRMIIPGTWTPDGMLKAMKSTFHLVG